MNDNEYYWEDSDYVSNFQMSEQFEKGDCEDNDEEYEVRDEKFRVIVFIQDVETGKCLSGWDEGFTEESFSWDFLNFLDKSSELYPYIGC